MAKIAVLFLAAVVFFSSSALGASDLNIGSVFPEIKLNDLNGSAYCLKPEGKPMVVAFFASWSKTCIEELSALQNLFQKLGQKIEVVGVSFDADKADLLNSVSSNKLQFKILRDVELSSPEKYKILVIPTTYIVDKDGMVKNIFVDYDQTVDSAIQKAILEETAD